MAVPSPMLATPGRPPADAHPHRWAIEMKYDGQRGLARCSGGRWRLYSRTGTEITPAFPEIAAGLAELVLAEGMVLDGEIVCPAPGTGAPSFRLLQQRMGRTRPTPALLAAVPAQLSVFDILHTGSEPVTGMPYRVRRALLDDLALSGPGVLTPPAWTGIPAETMLAVAAEHQLEGIVAKRRDSIYQPGVRAKSWIKTVLRASTDAVISGFIPAAGPTGRIGSLVLGAHDPAGQLRYLGHVGTGFTDAARRQLRAELDQLAVPRPPSRATVAAAAAAGRGGSVYWVSPVLVGTVRYREFTGAGLRHPSWVGLRRDMPAEQVTLPAAHRLHTV